MRFRATPVYLARGWTGLALRPKGFEGRTVSDSLRTTRSQTNFIRTTQIRGALVYTWRFRTPPRRCDFPFVLTTYRLTEHHTAGGMSRFLSHLAELQPEMFAEISPELATELKINNGHYICIVTLRGAIEARALVSRRMRPLRINGKKMHQWRLPYIYGTAGVGTRRRGQ